MALDEKKIKILVIIGLWAFAITFIILIATIIGYSHNLTANPCQMCEDMGNICTNELLFKGGLKY